MSGTKKGKEAPGSRRAPRDNAALRSFFDNLDFLPTEGAFVASDADRWRTAIYIVEQSGIADLLARWRAEDRGDKRPGPTPWLNETQVFTLFLILTLHRRPPLFTEMAAMLYHADQSLLDLLGVVKSDASETALFHRAYNTYHERLVPLLNPEPESLYRLMLKGDYAALVAERDVEDCQKRWERSITFTAALIWGCWMLLPREHRRKTTVDVVIDATHMASPGRGRGARSEYVSSDPTCGWYKRDGDHDGSQGAPATSRAKTRFKRTADELVWAREFTLLALCLPGLPRIVVGALLDQPGKRIAQNTLTLIDLLLAQGFTIEHFIGDMAYLPGCKMEELALPLRARGIKGVFEYPKDKTALGLQGSHGGAILVEGKWYCPSLPEDLINASADYFLRAPGDPRRITAEVYEARLVQRRRYELKSKQRADADGFERRTCPAEGAWATIKCGYKSRAAEDEKPGRTLIPVRLLVTPKPKVCQQASVTFPPEVDGKYGQHYAYRSPEWQRLYTSGRQTIESLNRSNKRGYFAPIKDPDWRPRRGWLPTLLAGLTLIIATNVRKIIAWAWDEIDTAHGFERPRRRKRRRELTAGYTRPVPNAPPGAEAA